MASTLVADNYIILWLNDAASNHDKVAVRDGLYTLLNDRSKVATENVCRWRVAANTGVVGIVLVINTNNLTMLKTDQSQLTLAKLNQWKTNNMDNPNHLRWARGTNPTQELYEAGLQPVTNGVER
jgi:hypothetical protein